VSTYPHTTEVVARSILWQEDAVRTTGLRRIGDRIYIQPEILFSQKGGNFTDIGIERTFKQTYIDVPILEHVS
jgi:hypothetical protein